MLVGTKYFGGQRYKRVRKAIRRIQGSARAVSSRVQMQPPAWEPLTGGMDGQQLVGLSGKEAPPYVHTFLYMPPAHPMSATVKNKTWGFLKVCLPMVQA